MQMQVSLCFESTILNITPFHFLHCSQTLQAYHLQNMEAIFAEISEKMYSKNKFKKFFQWHYHSNRTGKQVPFFAEISEKMYSKNK